jgi:uncharacterized protein YkwD
MGSGVCRSRRAAACTLACGSLALALAPGAAGGGACANGDAPATSSSVEEMDSAVVCLVNQQRTERGLPPLTVSAKLDRSAQTWTDAMVASGEFSHADLRGRIGAVHYDWRTVGENIATGYLTPRTAVAAWMASLDHCRNILDPSFRNTGTGERPAPVRGWATGPATWTQEFGLKMTASVPSDDTGPEGGCPYR